MAAPRERGATGTCPQGQPCLCASCKTTPSDFEREARNLSFQGNFQTFKYWPNFQKHCVGQTHHTHKPSAGAHPGGCQSEGLGPFLSDPLRITESKQPQSRAKKQTRSRQHSQPPGIWELGTRACPNLLPGPSSPICPLFCPIPVSVTLHVSFHLSPCLSISK